jgi:hypothetical protein
MPEGAHRLNTTATDLGSEDGAESVPPEPHRLVRDVDPALVQQIFHVPQGEREADVEHHRQADDLGARLEVEEDAGIAHARKATGSCPEGYRLPLGAHTNFPLTVPG